ncbi:MAG: hypothetical protein SH856_00550 [Flavobacteriales bacterium]|nr:hypothetical protein [Flavobacteriales bacterium]
MNQVSGYHQTSSLRKLLFTLLTALLLSASCVKDEGFPEKDYPDFFAFGQDFPWCDDETCVEFFRMESGRLAESVSNTHPIHNEIYSGDFSNEKSTEKYQQLVAIFKNNIPQAMLDLPSGLIGTENEFFKYMYFEYKIGSYHGYWHIEQNFSTVPAEIQAFMNTLSNAVFTAQN